MTKNEPDIVGREVKDMYGTLVGKVLGTLTDIDGSIQTVGVDCGSEGLKQIQKEQLVFQEDIVIYIPKWRLQAHKFMREKGLTLRRINALADIVSENDEMKGDAEVIHNKYKSELTSLDRIESNIKSEFLIPTVINNLVQNNQEEVYVLRSNASWFGVTYKEDKPFVINKIQELINSEIYSTPLL